ncbi:MAG: hypothetical protein A2Y30_08725 [Spirochaetes bacterium GWE1_32_154]|nr:MAG: hypothetical protein A2Y30_08725 [Spirochaetes bacterium GWE1_32_154]
MKNIILSLLIINKIFLFSNNYKSVVISGDSMSTGFAFLNTIKYSKESKNLPAGILAWPNMIRDAIIRNDINFKHATELAISTKYNTTKIQKSWKNSQFPYALPFNNKTATIYEIKNNDEQVSFNYSTKSMSDTIVLYFSKTPFPVGCKFDIFVNGKILKEEIDTSSLNNDYFGFQVKKVILKVYNNNTFNILLTNFKSSSQKDSATLGFFFLGIGTNDTDIYLTGRTSSNTRFYVNNNYKELYNRVINLKPDLLIFAIGSADMAFNAAQVENTPRGNVPLTEFKSNMISIIKEVKKKNDNIKIVIIGPSDFQGLDQQHIKDYNVSLSELSKEFHLDFLDVLSILKEHNEIGEVLLVDYVHFNNKGHTIIANKIINLLYEEVLYNDLIDSEIYF